ncbi:Gfo/Idh/MocA family oxidoreductase [Streptomyces sp. NPDC058374]|uniref:Gfo/Idh/MocA family protein n=1 Tax=Streptomyces sp. NPDC058374 TaxID=3346466 RepID=UPI0036496628
MASSAGRALFGLSAGRSVHADFGARAPRVSGHRLRAPYSGGGALLDLGTYPVSLAHLVLGRPDQVTAWSHLGPEGVDETTGMVLGYADGAMAVLSCSLEADSARAAVVHGTRGRIETPGDFCRPLRLVLHRSGHAPEVVQAQAEAGNGYVPQAREVTRCLREGATQSALVPLWRSLGGHGDAGHGAGHRRTAVSAGGGVRRPPAWRLGGLPVPGAPLPLRAVDARPACLRAGRASRPSPLHPFAPHARRIASLLSAQRAVPRRTRTPART